MAGSGKIVGKAALLALVLGHVAMAQAVSVEEAVLGTSKVRLYVHPFLTPDELSTLRLVMTNEQALALFVPGTSGFAALAASPSQGVIRDGKPVASAIALADLPDAAAAAKAATAACDGARKDGERCVVVLEIAPTS